MKYLADESIVVSVVRPVYSLGMNMGVFFFHSW